MLALYHARGIRRYAFAGAEAVESIDCYSCRMAAKSERRRSASQEERRLFHFGQKRAFLPGSKLNITAALINVVSYLLHPLLFEELRPAFKYCRTDLLVAENEKLI
jgi:hypothetical protein